MAIGVARHLQNQPPARGRGVSLFQPAEETGLGAGRVLQDPRFNNSATDFAIATHNLPGYPLASVVSRVPIEVHHAEQRTQETVNLVKWHPVDQA
jgi:metal-dependent amidase/aminoacylase/carboxypeptidase family protein